MAEDHEVTDPRDPMAARDLVTELDRWRRTPRTAENAHEFMPMNELLQRARDEIVALRGTPRSCTCHPDERPDPCQLRYAFSECMAAYNQVRDAALEEAAQRCDGLATDYTIPISANNWSAGCRGCAGRIRALKGEGYG